MIDALPRALWQCRQIASLELIFWVLIDENIFETEYFYQQKKNIYIS